MIAPYYAKTDVSVHGLITYRQTNDSGLLARATSDIRAAYPDALNKPISTLLIATWDKVALYFYHDKVYC